MQRESTFVVRCIDLELEAKRIYTRFARVFHDSPSAKKFFETLAQQEQDHADLLKACAAEGCWKGNGDPSWKDVLPRLERRVQAMDALVKAINCLEDALRFVIQIESSEINDIFLGFVSDTESDCDHKLDDFRNAMTEHIAYICEQIPEFAPELAEDYEKLRAKFEEA